MKDARLIPRPWSPVKDALADAETLRRFHRDEGRPLFNTYAAINCARRTDWQAPTLAFNRARDAARAAFRAVPGLRG